MYEKKNNRIKKDYLSGLFVCIIILGIGILFEWINKGNGVFLPAWPLNALIGLSFALILVLLHFFYSDYDSVKWLSRIPASISAIVFFTFLTLVLGLTIQNNPDAPILLKITGLDEVRTSFAFLLSGLYLLTTLGLVILRRFNKINYRNAGFLLNHLGLWIIIFAGSLGAGDVKRINIYLDENVSSFIGYNNNREAFKLPFALKLLDFDIQEFNTKLGIVNNTDMSFPKDIENNLIMLDQGAEFVIGDWSVNVLEYMNTAIFDSNGEYKYSEDTLAYPVALLNVRNVDSGKQFEAYISCGNKIVPPKFLRLDDIHTMVMTLPEPKEYSSLLELINSKGKVDTLKLSVNNPISIDGWKLYQSSFDENMGKYSSLSIVSAIKDPWLIIIYIGVFMLIAGSIYLFSIGKTPKEELQ